MNLVVGATGLLGQEICRCLVGRGLPVRALIRDSAEAEKRQALQSLGAELVPGDLRDPASLRRACQAVDAVITTATSFGSRQQADDLGSVDLHGYLDLLAAAREAGVRRFVYTSTSSGTDVECALIAAKRAVEDELRRSGLEYSILRPTCFMEVWFSPALGFDYSQGRVTIYGDGLRPISFISLVDVARFAVGALERPEARNATLELGGPEALAPLDVVRQFEEVAGRRYVVEHVPEPALRARYENAQDPLQKTFAALMLVHAHGDVIPMEATAAAFGLRLTSVRDYARRVLA